MSVVYEGMIAETVRLAGHGGDEIVAYFARPIAAGLVPGVVVIHHMPGWDEWTKEVVRKLAYHGYAAIAPDLYCREGTGASDDTVAAVRAGGGVADDRVMGDVEGAMRYLRSLPYANGKIGVIGFCSGGRHTYLAACRLKGIDAAVDCWGGGVIARADQLTEKRPVAPIDLTAQMEAPLLGIFGQDDQSPTPEQVAQNDEVLKQLGKSHEFHMYEGAGHGFFATDRAGHRPVQATDAWRKVFAFYEKHLVTPA